MHKRAACMIALFFLLAASASAAIVPKDDPGWDSKTREVNYYELVQDMLRPINNATKYVSCSDGSTECLWVPHFTSTTNTSAAALSTCSSVPSPTLNTNCLVTDEFSQVGQLVSMSNDSRAMQGFLNTAIDLDSNVSASGSPTKPYRYLMCWRAHTTSNVVNKSDCTDNAIDADANTADALYKCSNNLNFNSSLRTACRTQADRMVASILTYNFKTGTYTSAHLPGITLTMLPAGGGNVASATTNSGFFYSGYPGVLMKMFARAYKATGNTTYCNAARNVSLSVLFSANYTGSTFKASPGVHFSWNGTAGNVHAICTNGCGPPNEWDYDDAPRATLMGEGAYAMNESGCSIPTEVNAYLQNWTVATTTTGSAAHTPTAHSPKFYPNGTASIAANGGFYEHEGLGCALDLWTNQSNIETNCLDAITSHYNRATKKWDTTGDFGVYRQFFAIQNLGVALGLFNNTANVSANTNPTVTSAFGNSSDLSNKTAATLNFYCTLNDADGDESAASYVLYKNGAVYSAKNVTLWGSSDTCLQESANVSASCGALSTGNYSNQTSSFNVNYTIPWGTSNASLWQTKYGTRGVENNSLSSCWSANDTILNLAVTSSVNQFLNGEQSTGSARCEGVTLSSQTSSFGPRAFLGNACFPDTNDGDYSTHCAYLDTSDQSAGHVYGTCGSTPSSCAAGMVYEEAVYWDFGFPLGTPIWVASVPPADTAKFDNFSISCAGVDGIGQGSFVNSSNLTILNTAPVASDILIAEVGGGTSANCSYVYTDADSDPSAAGAFRWFKNGALLSPTSQTITSGNYTIGDSLICEVTPSDGTISGTATNSSTFVVGDLTPPTISQVTVPSSGTISDVLKVSLSCSDANPLATGFPKAQWTNPNSIVEGNFTMTLNASTGLYEKTYTFSIVGTYTGFTFYCQDGSGNLATSSSATQLGITAEASGGGGGGGGGTTTVIVKDGGALSFQDRLSDSGIVILYNPPEDPLVVSQRIPLTRAATTCTSEEPFSCQLIENGTALNISYMIREYNFLVDVVNAKTTVRASDGSVADTIAQFRILNLAYGVGPDVEIELSDAFIAFPHLLRATPAGDFGGVRVIPAFAILVSLLALLVRQLRRARG